MIKFLGKLSMGGGMVKPLCALKTEIFKKNKNKSVFCHNIPIFF